MKSGAAAAGVWVGDKLLCSMAFKTYSRMELVVAGRCMPHVVSSSPEPGGNLAAHYPTGLSPRGHWLTNTREPWGSSLVL